MKRKTLCGKCVACGGHLVRLVELGSVLVTRFLDELREPRRGGCGPSVSVQAVGSRSAGTPTRGRQLLQSRKGPDRGALELDDALAVLLDRVILDRGRERLRERVDRLVQACARLQSSVSRPQIIGPARLTRRHHGRGERREPDQHEVAHDLDVIFIGEAGQDAAEELVDVDLGEAGIEKSQHGRVGQLRNLWSTEARQGRISVLTRTFLVSRPSSTRCLKGPIST